MSNQVAKLFLRGKLMNKTAKNLPPEQVKEVEKKCHVVWNDPDLARAKTAFCSKLAWTIGNEYLEVENGLQEVWIVYWKTTVDILFHKPKTEMQALIEATCAKCSNIKTVKCHPCDGTGIIANGKCDSCYGQCYSKTAPEMICGCGSTATLSTSENLFDMSLEDARDAYKKITGKEAPPTDMSLIDNPPQRHKFFKTTLWTYFRQITNENKPKIYKTSTTIKEYAEKAAAAIVREIVEESCKTLKETKSLTTTTIETDTNLISMEGVQRLRELQDMMVSHNVEVWLKNGVITINKVGETTVVVASVRKSSRVNYLSLSQPDETTTGSSTYLYPNVFVESVAPPVSISEMEQIDGLLAVRRRLSPIAQKIFDLIINPPNEYCEKYSTNPVRRSNVSKFLNLSKSEVDTAWEKIEQATINAGLRP